MRYYSIDRFTKWIGKTTQTLSKGDKQNTFKPHHVIEGDCTISSKKEVDGK